MAFFSGRRRWRWPGLIGLLVVVAALAAWHVASRQAATAAQPAAAAAVPVSAAKVGRRDIDVFARGIGTVTAFRSVLVRARVEGYLAKIDFKEGQAVKAGQVLAQIDPRPYQAVLDQALAKKAADETQLKNAELNLARYAALSHDQFVTRQALDTQKALVGQLKANIEGDQAAIEAARLNLQYCNLSSPFDGVVGLRQVDIGNLVEPTSAQGIVTVTQIHPVAVLFPLPQEELLGIAQAMAAGTPRVVAYSSDGKSQISSGTLLARNNQVDTPTGTITLKAQFANGDNKLWPGQFVQARLQLRTDHNMVVIPRSSVQHGPDGLYVFVVKPNQTVASQAVGVGYQDDKNSEILKGLDGGEEIVVAGQSRLEDGTRVTTKQAPSS